MSRVEASVSWFKQTLGWSNSRESWMERLVGAAVLLCFIGLCYLGTSANAWLTVALWTVLAVTAAVLLRRGWLKLFGPVLFYDMLCTARRGRYSLIRCAYSLFLLLVLFWSWSLTFGFGHQTGREQAGLIAMNYFMWFTLVQLIAAFLLTPAYVAGSIAEEKERKTLEFLLATDLRNREIVLSKFGSRISNLALFVVTGLPILSFLQFLGGVDPDLVLASFAIVGLSVVGLASLGILNSVMFKRPRDAIAMTYFMAIGYLACATVGFTTKLSTAWVFAEPIWLTDWFFTQPPTYGDFVDVFNSGNIIAVIIKVEMAGTTGGRGIAAGSLATLVPQVLWAYFLFHGTVCLLCLTWSVVRLRNIALKQSYGKTEKLGWLKRFRPPVGDLPVLWKELNIEGGLRRNWLSWLFAILLVLLTLGSGVWIVVYYFWDTMFNPARTPWHGELYMAMNAWTRIAGTFVACLTLLGVAVRASTAIRSEIDKDTFDALITTPMSSHAILFGKFIGCIFSVRFGWLWLGSILALGLVTEGIYVLALPMVLGAWVVYAAFFTMIGLWFSMVSRTTMRATVYTVLTSIGLSAGHWLIWLCCAPMMFFMNNNHAGGNIPEYIVKFQLGITPPFVLGWFAYSQEQLADGGDRKEFAEFTGFSLLGLFLYTMASLMIWFVMIGPKFRQLTRRNQSSSEGE